MIVSQEKVRKTPIMHKQEPSNLEARHNQRPSDPAMKFLPLVHFYPSRMREKTWAPPRGYCFYIKYSLGEYSYVGASSIGSTHYMQLWTEYLSILWLKMNYEFHDPCNT